MNVEKINSLSKKLMDEFMDVFYLPHIEELKKTESEELSNSDIASGIIGFMSTAYLTVVMPILLTGSNKKKSVDDFNGLLNDMKELVHKKLYFKSL